MTIPSSDKAVGQSGHTDDHNSISTELTQHAADIADRVVVGSAFADISNYDGVDNTGATECATAIQSALDAIAALGQRAYAAGTFKIASTVTFAANSDFSDARFNYTGTSGTAVRVGTASSGSVVQSIHVRLPKIYNVAGTNEVGSGWPTVSASVGVEVSNLQLSSVWLPFVGYFGIGVKATAVGAVGCAYNRIELGFIYNNKVGVQITGHATGFTNENLWMDGTIAVSSSEGTEVAGCYYIETQVAANSPTQNVFMKPCLEGDVPQYHLSVGGSYNRFIQGRYEVTYPALPRVRWDSDAEKNLIDHGVIYTEFEETFVAGASGDNVVLTHFTHQLAMNGGADGVLILENTGSSSNPVDVIMPSGSRLAQSDPTTAYTVQRTQRYTNMKATGDTYPRVQIDHQTGYIYLGNGTAAPVAGLTGQTGILWAVAANLQWLTDNTYDVGTTSNYRPRDVHVGRNLNVGGALNHDGATVGFYGTAPVAQQTGVAVSAAGIHAALVNLGLITA